MEKNKAFVLMMSWKQAKLKKVGGGTISAPVPSIVKSTRSDAVKVPSRSVNPALNIAPYSSSPSATPSVVPTRDEGSMQHGEKRKISKDKSVSSKRRVPEGPLLAGPFDPSVHLTSRLEYNFAPTFSWDDHCRGSGHDL